MFEQEVELEQEQSSVVPLLLITVLILVIVGSVGYFLWDNRQVLTVQEANGIVSAALTASGPTTIYFETGMVTPSDRTKPRDPNYRLLEKAGFLKLGKEKSVKFPVELTSAGKQQLQALAGVQRSARKDGVEAYTVPIARRTLIQLGNITMKGPRRATVEFTWKWETNSWGDVFDASGPMVKSFNTWERATLIDKYGAKYYHAEPTKAVLAVVKTDTGWRIQEE